ncbi:MAG: exodeoxyribonuclease VII small subunit [Dehalococcoidia bacterium]
MAARKKEGFEALYRRLEETVARLEEGGLTLAVSLELYEEGMKLARRCQELLQEAELRVTQLRGGFGAEEEPEEESEARPPRGEASALREEMPLDGSTGSP